MDVRDRRPVVVGVDGGEHTRAAVRHAAQEARRRRVPLRLVHVVPVHATEAPFTAGAWQALESAGNGVLQATVAEVHRDDADLAVTATLRWGSRVAVLAAATEGCQLLVVGRESHHGVGRLVLGTTTAGAVAHAHCPVHVVPPDWSERPGTVVVGVASAEQLERILPCAVAAATSRGHRVRVVHAWTMPDPYVDRVEVRTHADAWAAAARAALEPVLARGRQAHPDTDIELRVEHADPVVALVGAAADDASLLVLDRTPWPAWLSGHLGRTTRHLLHRSPVVVEVDPSVAPRTRDDAGRPTAAAARDT